MKGGQAMIISVVFFLIIGLIVVIGTSEVVTRDLKNAQNIVKSRESYAIGEALHEDIVYRFKKSKKVGTSESLTLNGYTASSTIVDIVGGKRITTSADRGGYIKRVGSDLFSGAGTGFNYGLQVGEGGVMLSNSSSVSGNIYSSGGVGGSGSITSGSISPTLVGTVNVGPDAGRLARSGDYLYVVNNNNLQTVSIANPASPSVVSTVTNPNGINPLQKDIVVSGSNLFITSSGHNNVIAYSITNQASPVYRGAVAVTGNPRRIVVAGAYAYVASFSGNAIKVLNVSNPASMTLLATVATNAAPIDIGIQDQYLYVISQGGASSKLEIFSLANPALPTLVGSVALTTSPLSVSLYGIYAYVGSQGGGNIQVVNITTPTAPTIATSTSANTSTAPQAFFASGSYLYTAVSSATTKQFQVWNIGNTVLPEIKNTITITGGAPYDLASAPSGYIYLLTTNVNAVSPLRIYQATASGGNMVLGDVVSAGPNGFVTQLHSTGSIYANKIADAVAEKDGYFKTTVNAKVLGTSFPNSADQATSSLPISDAVIDQWKIDAENGGVITTPCPYKITGSANVTLGPIKINCDLEVSNSSTLTLAGMVWVKGNIILGNSGAIQISPSISGKTVAIIADNPASRTSGSKITLSNSTQFLGSGTNSYVMLVSQNNSAQNGGTVDAISVANSISGKVLIYAPHGQVLLQSSASVKEVTGWKIKLQNSSSVVYETGLANLIFTSGPSGGYQIQSWQEVE